MGKQNSTYPLLMTEEYWANTQLSVVRHVGQISFNGREYIIVNKEGKDIFECSYEAHISGREKAIEPGEPCDLVLKTLRPAYRRLGREKIIELIKLGYSEAEIKRYKPSKP